MGMSRLEYLNVYNTFFPNLLSQRRKGTKFLFDRFLLYKVYYIQNNESHERKMIISQAATLRPLRTLRLGEIKFEILFCKVLVFIEY